LRLARKFAALTWGERALVLEALVWLAAARAAVWVLPFRVLRRPPRVRSGDGVAAERLAWAIGATAGVVPRSTCLVRALAAQWMFARHGHAPAVRIGVRKSGGEFEAHAWLAGEECEGFVVLDGAL
jgi:hypothetical protein